MRKTDDSDASSPEVDMALVAGLASQAGALSTRVQELIDTVRLNRFARWFVIVVALVLVASAATNVWNTFATKHNTDIIVSCTDPNGKCYKESRKESGQTIKFINDAATAAAYCAQVPGNDTLAEVKACVVESLSHN